MNRFISRRVWTIALASLILAASAYAADVDGTWKGTVDTPNGAIENVFTFKAEGSTLTGSLQGMDGGQIPIKDGKIDGQNISFSLTLDFGGMPFMLSYKGVVSATEIKLTGDAAGQTFEFVVKKVQ